MAKKKLNIHLKRFRYDQAAITLRDLDRQIRAAIIEFAVAYEDYNGSLDRDPDGNTIDEIIETRLPSARKPYPYEYYVQKKNKSTRRK